MKRNVQMGIALVALVVIGAFVWLTHGNKRTHAPVFSGRVFVEMKDGCPVNWMFNPNGTLTVFNPEGPRLLFSGSYVATAHEVTAKLRDRSGPETSINFVIAENGASLKSDDGKTVLQTTEVPVGAY